MLEAKHLSWDVAYVCKGGSPVVQDTILIGSQYRILIG